MSFNIWMQPHAMQFWTVQRDASAQMECLSCAPDWMMAVGAQRSRGAWTEWGTQFAGCRRHRDRSQPNQAFTICYVGMGFAANFIQRGVTPLSTTGWWLRR